LKDKTLAGKNAIFDVTVLEASTRTLPEVTDEFANQVRAGLTAESLKQELRKAVDSEDAKEFTPARNAALKEALAEVMEVDVPDTLVTKQAKEKFAVMMTDMRNGGVSDEEIKNQISPENFLKYKKIVKKSIVKDFKVSMAVDEIGNIEGIEVPDYQVEEQMQGIREETSKAGEEFNEAEIRPRVEATLMREAVMEFLAEKSELEVQFGDEEFDEELMSKLADESLAREEAIEANVGESATASSPVVDAEIVEEKVSEPVAEEANAEPATAAVGGAERDYSSMTIEEKAYYSLLDAGALDTKEN
jgi:FKBP-type peptidyl-prolyl cis-trans isomerase (trigger factor)